MNVYSIKITVYLFFFYKDLIKYFLEKKIKPLEEAEEEEEEEEEETTTIKI